MPLNSSLLYVVGKYTTYERGRVWTIDPSAGTPSFSMIKEFNEGGYTQCTGCVIHDGKLWVSWMYDTDDGAVSVYDGSTWSDDITWTDGKAFDIVLFNGDLYVMKRVSGTQCEVVKRTGPGTWTSVLTITINSTTDPQGGLQVIKGDSDTEYLIAWPRIGFNASQYRFRYSTDGTNWNAASTTGLPSGWQRFSYLHWDETNSVYRLCVYSQASDYTAATIGGNWSSGAAHGHTSPYYAWGDIYELDDGDWLCAPNADTSVRRYDLSGSSWGDEYSLGAASQVDETNRASWKKWGDAVYLACSATDGKLISYDENTDTWTTVASIGSNNYFTDLDGPGRSPMRIFRHQIMRGTDGEAAITPDHITNPFSAVTKVMGSNVISADLTAPPGGESNGDAYVVATGGTGAWSGKDGHVMETPDAGSTWIDHGLVGTGDAIRLSSSVSGATFTGYANQIAEKTASGWNFFPTKSGMLCAQVSGTGGGLWDLESFIWDGSSWTSISEILGVATGDNALEIQNGEIGHVTDMGHGQEAVEYRVYSDKDQSAQDPAASSYTGHAIIMNNTVSYTDGDVYYSDGNSWTLLTAAASPLGQGSRIIAEATVEASCGLTANQIHENSTGTFGSASDWTKKTPHAGDIVYVEVPFQNSGTYIFERWSGIYDGSSWVAISKYVSSIDGDGIGVDSLERLQVKVKTNAGLAISSDELVAQAQSSAGYPNEPTAADPLVTKTYVDTVAQGLYWKNPSLVLRIKGDTDQGGNTPSNPQIGEAWVANNWGGAYADGNIYEWDGNQWNLILTNSGGYVPTGTKVTVIETGAVGSFSTKENNMALADGVGGWTFEAPTDGDAEIVYGDNSIYADEAYTYTGSAWTQFSKMIYTAGFGLDLSNNQFAFDMEIATWADKSSGTTWDTGLGATVDGDKFLIFRNGILQRKVASNPGDGEYTWSAGTATFGTAFNAAGEVVYGWGPGV